MPDTPSNTAAFFEQWAIYRKVIDHDFMWHSSVLKTIRDQLEGVTLENLLDLGCGDAHLTSQLLETVPAKSYTGVDLSGRALAFAEKNISPRTAQSRFEQGDLASFIAGSTDTFDAIVTGYSLHHLTTDAKETFLHHARARLRPGGRLILYDIFRQTGESLADYHDRYLAWIRRDWTQMTDREHALIDQHIRHNDFPETVADFLAMAQAAGFECKHRSAVDPAGDHVVIGLQ